jgi:hypothetical protein
MAKDKNKIELTEKEKAIVVTGIGLIIADAEKVSAAANRVGIQDAERAAGNFKSWLSDLQAKFL